VAASFRFVHAADLHLDTPFEGVARPAPEIAEALRDASLEAWDRLVDLTLERDAAFLLLAGDVYDGAERGVRAQLRFAAGLERLSAAGVETFIVHGNHDPLDGWSAIRHWPTGVTVFGSDEVRAVPVRAGDERLAVVHGISYARRDVTENLARRFARDGGPGLQIGLLHANVGAATEHGAYAPCTLSDLQSTALDYWALGHIHKSTVLRDGDPWVVYPGDTQGRSPKSSESGAKGAFVVEATPQAVTTVAFHALDSVRFVPCTLDVGGIADVTQLRARLVECLDEARDEHPDRGLLVRVTLTGRGAVAADLRRPEAPEALLAELRAAYDGARPFLWVEAIKDGSRAALDLDALRARDDFSGELLHHADALSDDPAALAEFLAKRTSMLDTGQVSRALRDLDPDDPAEIIDEALELALDALEREGDR
jgi:DNA repair protein SbcD/Mre11